MGDISVGIKFDPQPLSWFTDNAAEVFADGIAIYCNEAPSKGQYKLTDGVTALGALSFMGGPSSGGAVDSVVGTTNRITVDATDPANPIVDISPIYDSGIRRLLFYQNTDSSITGTLTETILTPNTWLVPAGFMNANSILYIPAYMTKTGTAGACTWKVLINTSYSLVGAVQLHTTGSAWSATTKSGGLSNVRLINRNSLTSQVSSFISSGDFNAFSTNAAVALTINTANQFYIMITATLANTGDTATLINAQVEYQKP